MDKLLNRIKIWCSRESSIKACFLVGSHANNKATSESDIDIVILSDQYKIFLEKHEWIEQFGEINIKTIENHGSAQSLRVFYKDNTEIEFTIVPQNWPFNDPGDDAALEVIRDGAIAIWDPDNFLNQIKKEL